MRALSLSAFFALLTCVAAAPFRLANVFGSSMVLQRDEPSNIWGWAAPSQPIYGAMMDTATNATYPASTTADATGLFVLTFPAQPAQTPLHSYTVVVSTAPIAPRCILYAYSCDGASITLTNVLIGDVLFCTGQSNMQVNVGFAYNSSAELAFAQEIGSMVRLFQVSASIQSKDVELDDVAAIQVPWQMASNNSYTAGFSATCWFTLKSVYLNRPKADWDIPLGGVVSTWGGTPIKAWTSAAVNQKCAQYYPYGGNSAKGDCGLLHAPCNASALYNAMVAPFAVGPMRFTSFTWFQGENDVNEYALDPTLAFYSCQLAGLATDLRARMGTPGAHWTTVQLAPYDGGSDLPYFRDMQCAVTAGLPNASCAVIVDDGDPLSPIGSVHSRNKELVGSRVAAGIIPALYGVTGAAAQATGPQYASATLGAAADGSMLWANVSFTPGSLGPGGTLVYVRPHVNPWQNSSRCPTELSPFTSADCDWLNILASNGKAYNATVVSAVNGGLTLSLMAPVSPPVQGIAAVGTRYGWAEWPVVNWYNSFGFPMVPWNVTA